MAKPGQEETSASATSSTSSSSSSPFGTREFQQAGRSAQSAARNAQAGVQSAASDFMSGTLLQPYTDLLGEMEAATRQWADGVRSSVEQTLNMAAKMNETIINEAKRTSDVYLRLCESSASMHKSMLGNAQNWVQRQSNASQRVQAAE